jgi:hypothetical protein
LSPSLHPYWTFSDLRERAREEGQIPEAGGKNVKMRAEDEREREHGRKEGKKQEGKDS